MKRLKEASIHKLRSISVASIDHKGDFQDIRRAYAKLTEGQKHKAW